MLLVEERDARRMHNEMHNERSNDRFLRRSTRFNIENSHTVNIKVIAL